MPTLTFDFENRITRDVTLRKMSLRQYLARAPTIGFSYMVDDEEPQWVDADDDGTLPLEIVQSLRAAAQDADGTFVAHNAAYDVRVARLQHHVPQPTRVHCSLEMAMGAFPNQPGGYSLKALARTLGLSAEKIDIDLMKACRRWPLTAATRSEIADYCKRDTKLAREIHQLAIKRLPPLEIQIGEIANAFRELHFVVRPEKVAAAIAQFTAAAADSVQAALAYLDGDGAAVSDAALDAFGWIRRPGTLGEDDPGVPKSVKAAKLKALLLDRLGFDTKTISYKKINPTHLAQNKAAAEALQGTSKANKAMSHQRRVSVFVGSTEVDAEHGAWRAHTYRYSSPAVGRGINILAMPKHDKAVAKPVREMFELPDGLCMVQGDQANVEYRMSGYLAGCHYIEDMFTRELLADPYSEFGFAATGVRVTKEDPARQVFKAAVLALSFCMGVGTWMSQLLLLISDPKNGVTLADLEAICAAQGWAPVTDRWAIAQQTKIHAPTAVLMVAYYTRVKFHEIHPEFSLLAKWLMLTVQTVSSAVDPERALDYCYTLATAPDRNKLNLSIDHGLSGRSIRATCGPWTQTVAWRDIGLHDTKFGFCLSTIQAGNKDYRKFTPNIAMENVASTCARNSIVAAKLELKRRGWNYLFSVHDALHIVCAKDRNTVLAAKADMLDILGPGNKLGWSWAAVINPNEVNVSRSMYERSMGELLDPIGTKANGKPKYPEDNEWWRRLEAGDATLLDNLP